MFLHEYLSFFYVILKNIITTGITLLHDSVAYNCSSNMPTHENHSKTVIYNNYFNKDRH